MKIWELSIESLVVLFPFGKFICNEIKKLKKITSKYDLFNPKSLNDKQDVFKLQLISSIRYFEIEKCFSFYP
jgi:hypothetical protein